jgi:hypothetical protein
MLPFLEIPQIIINNEDKEKEVATRLQPQEIAYYYPGFYYGTVIVLKSTNSFLTTLSVEEVDSALAGYHSFIMSKDAKFGNLQLTPKSKLHVTS